MGSGIQKAGTRRTADSECRNVDQQSAASICGKLYEDKVGNNNLVVATSTGKLAKLSSLSAAFVLNGHVDYERYPALLRRCKTDERVRPLPAFSGKCLAKRIFGSGTGCLVHAIQQAVNTEGGERIVQPSMSFACIRSSKCCLRHYQAVQWVLLQL